MSIPVVAYPITISRPPAIYRGDPYSLTVAMPNVSGSPVDLSQYGSAWTAMLRTSPDGTPAINWTVDATHLAAGYVILSLTGATTAGLTEKNYGFDIQATGGAVDPFTVWRCPAVSVLGDYTWSG